MRCKNVLKTLDDYVDGLLPAPQAERVRAHLDDCEACAADVLSAQAATSSMATWGDLEPPEHCFDAILARIDALPPEALEPAQGQIIHHPRFGRWAMNVGLGAAAAVLIGLTVWSGAPQEMGPRGPVRTRIGPNGNPTTNVSYINPGLPSGLAFDARPSVTERPLRVTDVEDLFEDAEQRDGLRRTQRIAPPRQPQQIPVEWRGVPAGGR